MNGQHGCNTILEKQPRGHPLFMGYGALQLEKGSVNYRNVSFRKRGKKGSSD